jgi:tight adherence protein C
MAWLIFGVICTALAVACAIWGTNQAFVEVPQDDRTYNDRPPRLMQLFWPFILLLSFRLGPLLSVSYRSRVQTQIRYAGLEFALSPEQFFAGKVLCGLGSSLLLYLLLLPKGGPSFVWLLVIFAFGFVYPDLWLKDMRESRQRKILKALPFVLDVITLCVESGLNLMGALENAVSRLPNNPLSIELRRAMRDIRAGRNRNEALRAFADRIQMPAVSSLVSAIITAEKQGANLGTIMRAQAEQRRNERFLRAEKLAMEAPVKMLFPLIAFIFPCTFLAIGFPIAMKFLEQGAFK